MAEYEDFYTDWIDIAHLGTMLISIPASYNILAVGGIWKGVNTVGQGWDDGSDSQSAHGDGYGYASCVVPTIDKYSTFQSGWAAHMATNWSGHTATLYMNGQNMGTVMNGEGKMVEYILEAPAMGGTIETSAYLVPSGQVGCSSDATVVFNYHRPITQTFYTTNPGFIINDNSNYKAQYIGVLGNGVESPVCLHNNPALFIPGQENKITHGVYGSQYAKFKLGIRYENSRPVPIAAHTVTLAEDVTRDLPLVAVDDPNLDFGDILSFVLPDGLNRVRYAADLVATDDPDATEYRISTHLGVLSWRKWY